MAESMRCSGSLPFPFNSRTGKMIRSPREILWDTKFALAKLNPVFYSTSTPRFYHLLNFTLDSTDSNLGLLNPSFYCNTIQLCGAVEASAFAATSLMTADLLFSAGAWGRK